MGHVPSLVLREPFIQCRPTAAGPSLIANRRSLLPEYAQIRMLSLLLYPLFLAPARDADLVDVAKGVPGIVVDLRYATPRNFTHTKLYPVARCFLVRPVARRLLLVQQDLMKRGLGLKIYDGYRPLSVAKRMWALVRDSRYVANPARGKKTHCRGAAVDVTLVDRRGRELPMPSGFDEFGKRAHRDYRGGSKAALANRSTLEKAMVRRGFKPLATEWWHFDAPDWPRYPVRDGFPRQSPATKSRSVPAAPRR